MTVDEANAEPADSRSEDERASAPPRTGGVAPLAAWAFAFLVLRVFAVSGYDWGTAFLVSRTIGVEDGIGLLFGSFMAGHLVVGLLLVIVLPLLLSTYLWSPNGQRPMVVLPGVLGLATLGAITVSFSNWWLPLATAAVFGVLALVHRLPAGSRWHQVVGLATARVGLVAGVTVLLVAVFVQTPWVPQERIETTDGLVIGYVLSVDSGYLNVLTEDHEFVILISSDVISRT